MEKKSYDTSNSSTCKSSMICGIVVMEVGILLSSLIFNLWAPYNQSSSYLAWLWNFVCMTTLIFFWIRQASQSTSYAPHHSRVLLHLAMSSYVMSCRTYAAQLSGRGPRFDLRFQQKFQWIMKIWCWGCRKMLRWKKSTEGYTLRKSGF